MLASSLSDKQLVHYFANGSEKALEILIHRHKRKIYFYIHRMVKDRDAAQDLFQETFIKVVREIKLGKYVEQNHFSAWLYRIAYNLTISAIRKSKAMPFDSAKSDFNPFDFILSNDDSNEDKFIKENNANIIKILIQKLPEEQREVVIMRYYSNMSFAEIAEVTNVSLNTSLGRMRYALAKLRKLIQNCQLDLAA